MWMRVACGIHTDPETHNLDVDKAIETYHAMSQLYCTHATPTLFNSGSPRPQLSSCFLLTMQDDSLDGIFSTLKQCAHISKYSGGIGLSIHNIRGTGSYIKGTAGKSTGIVPMLKVFNDTARYINQAGGGTGVLRFTWSRGTSISWITCNSSCPRAATMPGRGTCSTRCGFPTSS